jgi:transcriptional regulator with XRE-family HTH domain
MALVIAKPMDKAIQISGRKLAALRKRRYMTQEELSRALAISKGRVTAIEAEADTAMYLKNFRKLAEVLKIAPDELEKALAPGDVETVSVELPKEVYDSIAARAEPRGPRHRGGVPRQGRDHQDHPHHRTRRSGIRRKAGISKDPSEVMASPSSRNVVSGGQ